MGLLLEKIERFRIRGPWHAVYFLRYDLRLNLFIAVIEIQGDRPEVSSPSIFHAFELAQRHIGIFIISALLNLTDINFLKIVQA